MKRQKAKMKGNEATKNKNERLLCWRTLAQATKSLKAQKPR